MHFNFIVFIGMRIQCLYYQSTQINSNDSNNYRAIIIAKTIVKCDLIGLTIIRIVNAYIYMWMCTWICILNVYVHVYKQIWNCVKKNRHTKLHLKISEFKVVPP